MKKVLITIAVVIGLGLLGVIAFNMTGGKEEAASDSMKIEVPTETVEKVGEAVGNAVEAAGDAVSN